MIMTMTMTMTITIIIIYNPGQNVRMEASVGAI